MPALDRHDDVFVLDIGDTENRFHPDWIASVHARLDEVEQAEGPKALVVGASGKFFSNGLDLEWLGAHPEEMGSYLADVQQLFARLLELPLITVGALQGHTFAAGAMLSLSLDLRVMRADRGFWCLNEADIGLPFAPGMAALIRARLRPETAHRAMVTAHRFGGHDSLAAGIVDRTAAEGEVRSAAIELAAAQVAKAGPNIAAIKAGMYGPVLESLRDKEVALG
ncbi:enoyl-CoA hydratase-related protein [Streptomyces boninensis]|uniref:enoyl-CoA hydratase-related protein n=1 Tax=Streptomyces boninensis TaxID=2039455 RepID=UPI003B20FD93